MSGSPSLIHNCSMKGFPMDNTNVFLLK